MMFPKDKHSSIVQAIPFKTDIFELEFCCPRFCLQPVCENPEILSYRTDTIITEKGELWTQSSS